jgi:hypothetical protein
VWTSHRCGILTSCLHQLPLASCYPSTRIPGSQKTVTATLLALWPELALQSSSCGFRSTSMGNEFVRRVSSGQLLIASFVGIWTERLASRAGVHTAGYTVAVESRGHRVALTMGRRILLRGCDRTCEIWAHSNPFSELTQRYWFMKVASTCVRSPTPDGGPDRQFPHSARNAPIREWIFCPSGWLFCPYAKPNPEHTTLGNSKVDYSRYTRRWLPRWRRLHRIAQIHASF